MKKAYWIVQYKAVSDEAALKEYGKLAEIALVAGGGKLLVRTAGDGVLPFEAGIAERTVVVEFDNLDKAIVTRNGEAYQAAMAALGNAAVRDFRIVEAFA